MGCRLDFGGVRPGLQRVGAPPPAQDLTGEKSSHCHDTSGEAPAALDRTPAGSASLPPSRPGRPHAQLGPSTHRVLAEASQYRRHNLP